MNRFLRNPTQRIAWAIVLSLLLHGLVMWLPPFTIAAHEAKLRPLEAKLIQIPKIKSKIAAHKPKPKPPVKAPPQPEKIIPATPEIPIAASEPLAASEPVAASAPLAASEPVAASAPQAASEPVVAASDRPPLPKHARLRFSVYIGKSSIKAGESIHTLDIVDGHYTLKADAHTTGLVQVFKTYHIEQTSTGTATLQTLHPETFSEVITQSNHKDSNRADFDWANHKIHFTNGTEATLPAQALDILSTLYQFPPMHEDDEIITLNIATGKKFETFLFQVDFEESLKTEMGILETVHFRRLHKPNEEGLEIWFAQAYRLLPVKVRHLDREGKIDGEAIITEIRVSDD